MTVAFGLPPLTLLDNFSLNLNLKNMTAKNKNQLTFIDLFAGIGGFHLAFDSAGAKCVFVSEWDEHARKTYQQNFSKTDPELFVNGNFAGDIRKVKENQIGDYRY